MKTVEDNSKTFSEYELVYHIADIYVKDVTLIRTGFSFGTWKNFNLASVTEIAEANHAVLALSGDYMRARGKGFALRNGELYRKYTDPDRDVCVIYRDGTMVTIDAKKVPKNGKGIIDDPEVWQVLGFGPMLLEKDGTAKTKFNSKVKAYNPRSVIGYYEPGHYCFLFVEGRQMGYSQGIRMEQLAKLCQSLGMKQAFNLDGGKTAAMYFNGNLLNHDDSFPRDVHDVLYIAEPVNEESGTDEAAE